MEQVPRSWGGRREPQVTCQSPL